MLPIYQVEQKDAFIWQEAAWSILSKRSCDAKLPSLSIPSRQVVVKWNGCFVNCFLHPAPALSGSEFFLSRAVVGSSCSTLATVAVPKSFSRIASHQMRHWEESRPKIFVFLSSLLLVIKLKNSANFTLLAYCPFYFVIILLSHHKLLS